MVNPPPGTTDPRFVSELPCKTSFSGRSGFCLSQRLQESNSHFKRTCQPTHSCSTWACSQRQHYALLRSGSTWAHAQRQHCALPIKNQLNFSKGKPKNLWRHDAAKLSKDGFCVKDKLFLGKNGFSKDNQLFRTKNKKRIFLDTFLDVLFSFFWAKNGFPVQNHFFLRKNLFCCTKPSLS